MAGRPSIERLHELFSYDEETGEIRWKVSRTGRIKAGMLAGTPDQKGYRLMMVDRYRTRAHHIAWAMHYNEWAPDMIDHINGQPSDNRISNLRLCSHQQNMANKWKNGSHRCGPKHRAMISHRGERMHLGLYATAEQARAMSAFGDVFFNGAFAHENSKQLVHDALTKSLHTMCKS